MDGGTIKWDWPIKREEAEGAKLRLIQANPSVWFDGEATVCFVLHGQEHHGWMPDYSVNIDSKWLKAFIVGDYANGDWQIMIPNETMLSTEFLRIPKSEQGKLVQLGWW